MAEEFMVKNGQDAILSWQIGRNLVYLYFRMLLVVGRQERQRNALKNVLNNLSQGQPRVTAE
jgi:hypothetical protein